MSWQKCSIGTPLPVVFSWYHSPWQFWPWQLCRQHAGLIQGHGPRLFPSEVVWARPRFPEMGCECEEQKHFDGKSEPDNSCGPTLKTNKDIAFSPHSAGDPIKPPLITYTGKTIHKLAAKLPFGFAFLLHLLGVIQLYFCPSSWSVQNVTWRTYLQTSPQTEGLSSTVSILQNAFWCCRLNHRAAQK